jgi:tetratricopeptide (TPR) repeat protein
MTNAWISRFRCCVFALPFFLLLTVPCAGQETDDYIHYQLGLRYKNENKSDQALEEFRKLLSAYPDNYNAYMQIADIRRMQGQPRLVIYNLKRALAYNPGWGKAQKMLAEAYEQDRQFQNAIIEYQHYQQACDPAELDSIQSKINRLVGKVKGEPEPVAQAASSPAQKDTLAPAKKTVSGKPARAAAAPEPASARSRVVSEAGAPRRKAIAQPAAPTAESHFNQAVVLYNEEKFDEALGQLKKAVTLKRDFPAAYYYAGLIRFKKGENDLAKINFAKAFGYPEGEGVAHFYLGRIYGTERNFKEAIVMLLEFLQKPGDPDQRKEAVALLKQYKAIVGDPTPLPAGLGGPDTVRRQEPLIEPVAPETSMVTIEMRIDSLLTLAVVDTLSDPGQAMLVAVKEFRAGRYESAAKEFKKVMVSFPAKAVGPQCLYDIGACYMKLRLFSNAENQFDQLLERYPAHALASQSLFFKAYSFLERGDLSRAERLLREFIQKNRTHQWTGRAYEKLGDLYTELKESGKALDAYNQAVAQAHDAADRAYALYKLGSLYFEVGNGPRAVESLEKLIENGEKSGPCLRVPDSYYRIADYEYQHKNFKRALEFYQKVTRKYPTYQETPWGLFQAGNIYKNTKDYQKAIETYKVLAKTYPDDYWAKQAKWKMEDAVWENEYRSVLN